MVSTLVRDGRGVAPTLVEPTFIKARFRCMLMKFAFNHAGEGILTLRIPHDYVEAAGNFKGAYGVLLDAMMERVVD
jgi:hypothetical protein